MQALTLNLLTTLYFCNYFSFINIDFFVFLTLDSRKLFMSFNKVPKGPNSLAKSYKKDQQKKLINHKRT